jgi:hypothetical protein
MTKQELKAKIDKLENGIKSKATPSNLIAPLKAQKAKLEKELEDMEAAEKKAVKTKKVSKVAEKIKAAKKSAPAKTPAKAPAKEERKKDNIVRDGDRKSLPAGKRISKTGKVYYEMRANRTDKQTSRKPYLAKGGEINWGEDLGNGFSIGNDVVIIEPKNEYKGKEGFIIGKLGDKLEIDITSMTPTWLNAKTLVSMNGVKKIDTPMADGGETEEGVDLFEDYENIPSNVQEVLDKYSDAFEDGDYRKLEKANNELKKIGYTFEYGLDGEAYDLRKIGQRGKMDEDEYAKGGELQTAQLLIIDPSNPLSSQVKKITGDYLNSDEYKDISVGNFNILTHKASKKVFIVYPKRIYDSLPEQEKQDDINYLKNVEKIKLYSESMADGGAIKGKNNKTGETYGVVIGSIKKADEYVEGGTQMNVRKSYDSRISESIIIFDENGNLYSIGDFGSAYEGKYPSTAVASFHNYFHADKKETLQVLSKEYTPAFAKKLIGLAKGSMADGGYVIFEGRDNYNDKPLYKVISKDEDNDYDGEFHDNREDAEKELKELKNKDMNYGYGGKTKSRKSTKDLTIEQMSSMTGVGKAGIERFSDENNLSEEDLSNIMQGLGRRMISASDFATAVSGNKGNQYTKEIVDFAKSGKGYKMADGGYMAKGGEVPAHFGSGRNIEVFGYQTQHFDICGAAVKEFEAAVEIMQNAKESEKESLARCAKYVDGLFGIEKLVVENSSADDANFYEAVSDIMSASIYNYRAEMSINLFSFVPQHLKEIAVRMAKAEKGGLYALGGMTAGRWYRDKSGEEFKFIGKIDSGENKGKFLFTDGQKSVYKDLEDFEGGRPKETKLFGFFEDGGSVAEGNYEMLMSNIKAIKHHAEELEGAVNPNTEIEAWVLSKSERAETDLSDITHYLDGLKMEKGGYMAKGGEAGRYKIFQDTDGRIEQGFWGVFDTKENYLLDIFEFKKEAEGYLKEVKEKGVNDADASKYNGQMDKYFEKGGYMAKGGDLSSIKKKYEENEDENAHSENVVLLAKHFGTKEDLAKAKEILALHEKEGSLSSENGKKRQELHLKLIDKARAEMDKQGIEFEKGGMMAKGGEIAFDNSNLYLNGFGMDSNGNSVVKVSFPNQRAFSIQTNGVLKETNNLYTKNIKELTEAQIKTIEKEVVDYVKQFGSKEQKQRLKTYSGYMAKGGEFKPYGKTKGKYKIEYTEDGEKQSEVWESKEMVEDRGKRLLKLGHTNIKITELKQMAKGGIYSSDSLYILKVSKDGKEVGEERFRAKNIREAKEMGEDYEEKYKIKFGGDLSFSVKEAMADGGKVGGRGWENYEKGKRITKISELKVGEDYLIYNKQFNAKNIIRITSGDKTPLKRDIVYGGFVRNKNDKKIEGDFAIWGYELKDLELYEIKEMADGGKVKFADKVKSVQESLLKRKKVSPKVQKDYGKTYSKAEAKESAQRIVGSRMAQLKEKMAKKKK